MERIEEKFRKEWHNGSPDVKVHTSGSTGKPKLISLPKEIMRRSALRTNSFFGITQGAHLHSCISPEFIGGKMMIVRSIIADALYTSEQPSNRPLEMAQDLPPIDLLAVVPSQMWGILNGEYEVPEIRNIIIGGAPIPSNLRRAIINSGLQAWETYGMTETASHIALKRIAGGIDRFTTLGDVTVSTDSRDCLVIEDGENRLVTNDVATVFSPTEFRIEGRYDNMIITGGKKLNPLEVEEELRQLTDVRFYVSSTKDDLWGEKVVVVIDGSDPHAKRFKTDWEVIRQELKRRLPAWKIPKGYVTEPTFSLTPNGKLIRKKFS